MQSGTVDLATLGHPATDAGTDTWASSSVSAPCPHCPPSFSIVYVCWFLNIIYCISLSCQPWFTLIYFCNVSLFASGVTSQEPLSMIARHDKDSKWLKSCIVFQVLHPMGIGQDLSWFPYCDGPVRGLVTTIAKLEHLSWRAELYTQSHLKHCGENQRLQRHVVFTLDVCTVVLYKLFDKHTHCPTVLLQSRHIQRHVKRVHLTSQYKPMSVHWCAGLARWWFKLFKV